MDERSEAGIQSVTTAGAVLRALLRADGPARLSDVARDSGLARAKAHRYLASLVSAGLAARDPVSRRYDLGPLAMSIGLAAFARFAPLRAAELVLRELAGAAGETCALSLWGDGGPAIVRVAEARHDLAATVALNHRCPLTYSATGLVFAAHDAGRAAAAVAAELAQNRRTGRPRAPWDAAALEPLLAAVRRDGVASIDDAGGEGRAALAAPVFGAEGELAMVLTLFGPLGRMDVAPDGRLAGLVKGAAGRLSGALRGVG